MDTYVTVNVVPPIKKYFISGKKYLVKTHNYRFPGNIVIIDEEEDEHCLTPDYYNIVNDNSIDNKEFQYESIPNLI